MTDAEIIKALEVCVGIHNDCEDCPLLEHSQATDECMTELMSNALDLINRQKADIEKLKKGWKADVIETKNTKAEAIKEFAERLKEQAKNMEYKANTTRKTMPIVEVKDHVHWVLHEVIIETIDNLVKEMAGDTE